MVSTRIDAIDTLKGISMIMIWYCHLAWPWHTTDWEGVFFFQWMVLDFFGPAMFVSLSAIGYMFSTRRRLDGGDKRLLPASTVVKASYLFIIGECINAYTLWYLGIFHVFGWNVITTIGLFSLLVPLVMRLRRVTRLVIAMVIALTYFPLVEWSMGALVDAGVAPLEITASMLADTRVLVYFILFFHPAMTPVYSWLLLPLLGSVIFDTMVTKSGKNSPRDFHDELKRIAITGVLLVLVAMAASSQLVHSRTMFVPGLHAGEQVPAFWIRHTPQYMIYNLGVLCLFFAGVCTWQVKGRRIPFQDHVNTFGRYSLTAFLASHLGFLVPVKLWYPVFLPVFVLLMVLVIKGFHGWDRAKNGLYSAEWLMVAYTSRVLAAIDKRARRQQRENVSGS